MKDLSIDIETCSGAELSRSGVYRYAEDPGFGILLFGYASDGGAVRVIDLAGGEAIPEDVLDAICDERVTKHAYNAGFERVCLSRYLTEYCPERMRGRRFLSPQGWQCTMVWSAYLGLPLSLADAGKALGLEKKKLESGRELIRLFCRPKEDRAHDPEKWRQFIEYNRRDVETEMEIQERLKAFPVPEEIWEQYRQDQEINDRGILLDMQLVREAIRMDETTRTELAERMREITGIDNPNSTAQMKAWLAENGRETKSLGKKQAAGIMQDAPEDVREALALRQQLAKNSVRKYRAMEDAVCADGRARGMFQFYGANRTGRFSGRLIQLQNLPQTHLEEIEAAREMVRNGDLEGVKERFGDVPDTLSQLIRTAFIAPEGKMLYVADFSAIEARVLAWAAGEKWRMKLFHEGGDIYCGSASKMFGVPVEKGGVNGELRQKGKIAELALGYGGSEGALKAMGAVEMGLKEEELKPLVDAWRSANPQIVRFWREIQEAALGAVRDGRARAVSGIGFICRKGMLFVRLPGGRCLAYAAARIERGKFGGMAVTYLGMSEGRQWKRIETYGAKICENVIQGIARDVLCEAMQRMKGRRIVAHVHDEVVIEAEAGLDAEDICREMSITPEWADGLELKAEGFVSKWYRKG